MAEHKDDPATWPALGQALTWVDVKGNPLKLVFALSVACTVVVLAQLTYESHPHTEPEKIFGFYAAYGFIMFTALIFAATGLRYLVGRRDDYYAPHVIDTEDYPPEELGLEEVDD